MLCTDAVTPAQFAQILAVTESSNNPQAWGDSGLAMGAWQVHPAWVYDRMHSRNIVPAVRESWTSWVQRMVEDFYEQRAQHDGPAIIAMTFHIGHRCDPGSDDWDYDYAKRFAQATGRVLGTTT